MTALISSIDRHDKLSLIRPTAQENFERKKLTTLFSLAKITTFGSLGTHFLGKTATLSRNLSFPFFLPLFQNCLVGSTQALRIHSGARRGRKYNFTHRQKTREVSMERSKYMLMNARKRSPRNLWIVFELEATVHTSLCRWGRRWRRKHLRSPPEYRTNLLTPPTCPPPS